MGLAEQMKNLSDAFMNINYEFNKGYETYIEKIKAKASEGFREISWYANPFENDYSNPNRAELLDMLKRKLESEGFRHVYGYQIGKPLGNSQSQYIIW